MLDCVLHLPDMLGVILDVRMCVTFTRHVGSYIGC